MARRLGLSENTVLGRAHRESWAKQLQEAKALAEMPSNEISPAKAITEILAEDGRETRLSLSKSTRKMAKQAEDADLSQAQNVVHTAKAASLIHGWDRPGEGQEPKVRLAVIAQGGGFVAAQLDLV